MTPSQEYRSPASLQDAPAPKPRIPTVAAVLAGAIAGAVIATATMMFFVRARTEVPEQATTPAVAEQTAIAVEKTASADQTAIAAGQPARDVSRP